MNTIHLRIPSAILTTDRLLLKEMNPDVLNEVYATLSDEEIRIWYGLSTIEEVQQERAKHADGLTMNRISFRTFLMIEQTTGEVIGRIGYHWWHVPHSRAEIGYALYKEVHKGQGYMTEAIKAVLHYGFTNMKLNRIEAFVGSNNTPSLALVAKMGFTKEGLLREHYCKNEVIEDSVCFSLLKREYDARAAL